MAKAPKAVESTMTAHEDGSTEWRDKDGKRHRDDGPAVTYPNGLKMWFQHGVLHRDRGPAIECADGSGQWWQHGAQLSQVAEIELKARLETETSEKKELRQTPVGRKNNLSL